jgi:glycosyltransferase involved in cell wall biosynthesis
VVAARGYGEREQRLLESALTSAGIRGRFTLHYNLPFSRMQPLMESSRVGFLLYPGSVNYAERIPIRIFEYMAAGLPFVASDLPTTARFTSGRGVAELVPAGDAAAYAGALAALLADPARQAEMSRRGPALAREEFNWQQESRKLVSLYGTLIGPP